LLGGQLLREFKRYLESGAGIVEELAALMRSAVEPQ
jgi:hypothetical protein